MATLRLRIKNLEEKNRELTGLLELVYGERLGTRAELLRKRRTLSDLQTPRS